MVSIIVLGVKGDSKVVVDLQARQVLIARLPPRRARQKTATLEEVEARLLLGVGAMVAAEPQVGLLHLAVAAQTHGLQQVVVAGFLPRLPLAGEAGVAGHQAATLLILHGHQEQGEAEQDGLQAQVAVEQAQGTPRRLARPAVMPALGAALAVQRLGRLRLGPLTLAPADRKDKAVSVEAIQVDLSAGLALREVALPQGTLLVVVVMLQAASQVTTRAAAFLDVRTSSAVEVLDDHRPAVASEVHQAVTVAALEDHHLAVASAGLLLLAAASAGHLHPAVAASAGHHQLAAASGVLLEAVEVAKALDRRKAAVSGHRPAVAADLARALVVDSEVLRLGVKRPTPSELQVVALEGAIREVVSVAPHGRTTLP